jgi:hypothetical protein
MDKIKEGGIYTRDELEARGLREVGPFGNGIIFLDGLTRRLLWDPGSHKITLVFNDEKRYATH